MGQGDAQSVKRLRPDRWWNELADSEEAISKGQGRCIGTECKIWARAKRRCDITHELCGGGAGRVGYLALPWQVMLNGSAGSLGDYNVLRHLPEKIAKYLFEYHAEKFPTLLLPAIPLDRSLVDVHGMMNGAQVA